MALPNNFSLIFGNKIVYKVGYWADNYCFNNDKGILGMIFQIFSETVFVINNSTNNVNDEMDLLELAFEIFFKEECNHSEFYILYSFLRIKKEAYLLKDPNFEEVEILKNNILNSSFSLMLSPLLKSIFSSIGINSFADNKQEFERLY